MSICEKCWADAHLRMQDHPEKSQTDHYYDLLFERRNNPCTEKEQKGIQEDEEN